jgi:hypothetical protein
MKIFHVEHKINFLLISSSHTIRFYLVEYVQEPNVLSMLLFYKAPVPLLLHIHSNTIIIIYYYYRLRNNKWYVPCFYITKLYNIYMLLLYFKEAPLPFPPPLPSSSSLSTQIVTI